MTGLNTKVLPIPTSRVSWFHIPLFYKVLLIRFVILNLKLKCVVSGWPYRNWPPNLITPRICENRQMCQAYLGPSKPCFKYFICRQGKDPLSRLVLWEGSARVFVSLVSPSYNRCSLSMAFYTQKMYSCMFCMSELLIGFTARRMLLSSQYLAEVCQVKVKRK